MAATPADPGKILQKLREKYPDARYELNWSTPLDLLVATILAAQCTDERVNKVTVSLFPKYPSARAYAEAKTEDLEEDIKPTGFYRNKAKAIQGACRALVDRFGGEVPRTMKELVTLPGVARKTANVVLNTAWNIPSGVIVDTHVARVSPRMGLTKQKDPEDIEKDLMRTIPESEWTFFGPAMVLHGRYTCTARAPKCGACSMASLCPKKLEPGVTPAEGEDDEEETKSMATKTKSEASTKSAAKKAPAKKAAPAKESNGATAPAKGGAQGGGMPELPDSWREVMGDELGKPYFAELSKFLADERKHHEVFPPASQVFSALELTHYDEVNVVILGQDPYHDDGQAHGLSFSVQPGIAAPPSLVNMFKELSSDVGFKIPNNGYLVPWAQQGVLMLNAVLTVRAHTPNSHKDKGWETFTDAVLRKINEKRDPVIFVLWGGYAQKKAKLIDTTRHTVIQTAHPSPLSARNGFFGSKCFSKINEALRRAGKTAIDWQLPDR